MSQATTTNVNIFLESKTAEGLIELQLINNALNGVHYNYQTPTFDGKVWRIWFFADVNNWSDPSELDDEGKKFLEGLK